MTAIQRYAHAFETISTHDLGSLMKLYSDNARFSDPFNEVQGAYAINQIFEDMMRKHPNCQFSVTEIIGNESPFYLRWKFAPDHQRPLLIEGVSRVTIDDAGKVSQHIDYWDACSQLYTQLPLVGAVCKIVRRIFQTRIDTQRHNH
ncbi:MAG: nuclear transport factor 2 family protein [bacterium]